MVVPQKTKQITLWSNNSTSGYALKYWKWGQKEVFADRVHNISHTSREVEGTQCLLVDKQSGLHTK